MCLLLCFTCETGEFFPELNLPCRIVSRRKMSEFSPTTVCLAPSLSSKTLSVPWATSCLEIMRDNDVAKCLQHNTDERWSRLLFHLIACQYPEASAVSFLWLLGSKAFCGAHLSEFPQLFQFLYPSVSCWKSFLLG